MPADNKIKLQVLICTFGARLLSIDGGALPRVDGVGYLICCQDPDASLDEALSTDAGRKVYLALTERDDIDLRIYRDRGLSINRNHALAASSAPYIYVADDDLTYNHAGFNAIIDAFESAPSVDIIALHSETSGTRIYPPDKTDLSRPYKGHFALSIELAMRRDSVVNSQLHFTPLVGIGAPRLGCGEEGLLLESARRRGLSIMFRDITPVSHPGETTSARHARDARIIRAKGAVMVATRGFFTALTRLPVEAHRAPVNSIKALWWLSQGVVYYFTHRRQLL